MQYLPESTRREILAAVETTRAAIPPSLLRQIEMWQRKIAERAEEARLFAPFVENGLCLAPSMPQELVDECMRRQEAEESVVDCVLAWSRADECAALKNMVNSWRKHPFIAIRTEIMEEALHLHLGGHYAASVALLVSQPEGIALDWVYDADAMEEVEKEKNKLGGKKDRAKQEYSEMLDVIEGTPYPADDLLVAYTAWYVPMIVGMQAGGTLTRRGWTSMHTFIHFCDKVLYKKYRLFEDHDTFMNSETLNRHAIVHGSALRAGTEINSLRLLLALDVLALVRD